MVWSMPPSSQAWVSKLCGQQAMVAPSVNESAQSSQTYLERDVLRREPPVFRLDKKIAFVTGAGSGIGEQIARLFAQQGAHVILADIRPEGVERVGAEIRASGGSVRAQQLDVAEESH